MRRLSVALLSVIPFLFFLSQTTPSQAVTHAPVRDSEHFGDVHPRLLMATAATEISARAGSSLSQLAGRIWGKPKLWPVLWWDNRSKIPDPNVVTAGQHLRYGRWDYVRPWLRHRADAAIPAPPPAPRAKADPPPASAAPAPAPAPAAPSTTVNYGGGGFEACVIQAESGGDPTAINPSSGASGLFGFLLSTWMGTPEGASYPGGAYTAPPGVQEAAFSWVYARDGTSPWAPYDGC